MIESKTKNSSVAHFWTINFLRVYTDFAYYTCLSPFRLVYNFSTKTKGTFISAAKYFPQRILCVILSFLVIFWHGRVLLFRLSLHRDFYRPGTYFEIAYIIVELIQKSVTLKHFWWNLKDFQAILHHTCKFFEDKYIRTRTIAHIARAKIALRFACLPYMMLAFLAFFTGKGGFGFISVSEWSFWRWWHSIGCMARMVYLFKNETIPATISCGSGSIPDTIGGIIGAVILFQR